jgi:hypothetical protein
LRLHSVAKAKPPGIKAVSSTSVATRTGSIGQYGAGSQVAHEIRAKQDSGASLSTASGRDESERVDAGRAGSKGGSLGALGKGVGGWRYAATSLLPPSTCEGPRRERLGPRILKDLCGASKARRNLCQSAAEHLPPEHDPRPRSAKDYSPLKKAAKVFGLLPAREELDVRRPHRRLPDRSPPVTAGATIGVATSHLQSGLRAQFSQYEIGRTAPCSRSRTSPPDLPTYAKCSSAAPHRAHLVSPPVH